MTLLSKKGQISWPLPYALRNYKPIA